MSASHISGTAAEEQRYQLPNGLFVYHLNKYETDFTYNEIFEDKIYLKNGIKLKDDTCIFDIGANIGLFTLFVKQTCPDARIFTFEPAPDLFELLSRNTADYCASVQNFQCGISDKEEKVNFTYYPNYSILSGFHSVAEEDNQTLSEGVRSQLQKTIPKGVEASKRMVDLLTKDKLKDAVQFECQLRTVSSILRETKIGRIDLLKIDAEKSELQVLEGIEDNDWKKIDQIVMEAHSKQISDSIQSTLRSKGFKVISEQEDQFLTSGITNIFAIRP